MQVDLRPSRSSECPIYCWKYGAAQLKRLVVVIAVALTIGAFIIAVLPVSVGQIACNPSSIARAESLQSASANSYVPAFFVWMDPTVVVPAGDAAASADAGACGSAAESHMIPALILGAIAALLALFGARAIEYIRSGDSGSSPITGFRAPQWAPPKQPREAPGAFNPMRDYSASSEKPPPAAAEPMPSQPENRKVVARLACQHFEEIGGDPETMIGKTAMCRTCGPQIIESVVI